MVYMKPNYNYSPEAGKIKDYMAAETIEQRIKRLIKDLRSGKKETKSKTTEELIKIGKPAINEVAKIIYSEIKNNRINDDAMEVVVQALFILGGIDKNLNFANPRINDAVKYALNCKNGYVRKVAEQVWADLKK